MQYIYKHIISDGMLKLGITFPKVGEVVQKFDGNFKVIDIYIVNKNEADIMVEKHAM